MKRILFMAIAASALATSCRKIEVDDNGTAEKPVVFTSDQATPQRGDWGGIVILGRARTNASFNGTAGVGKLKAVSTTRKGWGFTAVLMTTITAAC